MVPKVTSSCAVLRFVFVIATSATRALSGPNFLNSGGPGFPTFNLTTFVTSKLLLKLFVGPTNYL